MPLESKERDIFAIVGLAPEVQAVAFAKYSRSQESVRTTIDDLTDEKSAEFHEKWVIGFGDASVADMAVIAIALENVTVLASKAIEDSRLASYQEKSTRYVPFNPKHYHKPNVFMANPHTAKLYTRAVEELTDGYVELTEGMIAYFRAKYPKPETMTDKAYENKLRARSLDVSRYLLPTSTLTNLGLVASARELRVIISKLLGGPTEEIRAIGEEIRLAALERAYNPNEKKLRPIIDSLTASGVAPEITEALNSSLRLSVKGAPTLVKHCEPKEYLAKKNALMSLIASFIPKEIPNEETRVDFVENISPEDELIAGLLYPHTTLPFRALVNQARAMTPEQKAVLIGAVQSNRTPHDNCAREFEVGGGFIFDTLMDYGAFCDLQRHRLTTQINQPATTTHGYEVPRDLAEAGLLARFEELLANNKLAFEELAATDINEARYVLAKAWRKRTLFKMNLRELYHFVELRSRSGGHFSYRTLVYEMYEKFRVAHPALVADLRAIRMDFDADFFGR